VTVRKRLADSACEVGLAHWRGQAIELLARNFSPGDHVIALRWFETEEDLETLHSLGMDFKDLWERYPDEETEVPMLLALYERGPCSFCRERTVHRLIERRALTEDFDWNALSMRTVTSAILPRDRPQCRSRAERSHRRQRVVKRLVP
jgi:hypothetical protein